MIRYQIVIIYIYGIEYYIHKKICTDKNLKTNNTEQTFTLLL